MKYLLLRVAVFVGLLGSTSLMNATPISGSFSLLGSATVSLLGLDFAPGGLGFGNVVSANAGNTGDFVVLNGAFSPGTIRDRTEATQPVGQPLNVADYIMLSAMPNLQFTLEFILPGVFSAANCFAPPANQQNCTVPPFDHDSNPATPAIVSPYNLTNYIDAQGNLSSSASFSVRGTVLDTNTGDLGNFQGTFTATFLNTPFQTTVGTVLGAGSVTVPFSATFDVVAIPEPSALTMFALGLGALVGSRRLLKRF